MDVRFPLLPPLPADGDHPTSVSCPSCAGTLAVRIHRTLITFVCYIGHVYSVPELLAAKEDRLEQRLWTALSSLEEIAMLLEDFERRGVETSDPEVYRRRSAMAREHAARLKSLIEADRPLMRHSADD